MPDEKRSARRAHINGIAVTYEGAAGGRIQADAMDLGVGGLFIKTSTPLAPGKRIALEIQVAGENELWSALGRVVWSRDRPEGGDRPAGMGVKLIDMDEAVAAAIDRLVQTRERTDPGLGEAPAAPAAPIVSVTAQAPGRERTIQGVGMPLAATGPALVREESVAVPLVTKRDPAREEPTARILRPSLSDPPKKRTGVPWGLALLVLGAIAVVAYVLWDAFGARR